MEFLTNFGGATFRSELFCLEYPRKAKSEGLPQMFSLAVQLGYIIHKDS